MSALLSLPWEIREQIWIYSLQRDNPVRRPRVVAHYELYKPTTKRKEVIQDNVASLLCTCRQAEEEGAPIFYGTNDVSLYFSRYVDQADHKSDAPLSHSLPSSQQWAALSDTEKHQALGLGPRYATYILSLVVYNDATKGFSFDHALQPHGDENGLTGCDVQRTSDLLAEMLIWVRQKAPQVHCISVRYMLPTEQRVYAYTGEYFFDRISHFEPRFWRSVKRFRSLCVLELGALWARPGHRREWGKVRSLYLLPETRSMMARVRNNFWGPNVRNGFFRARLDFTPGKAFEVERLCMRWVFLIDSLQVLKNPGHTTIAYIRWKTSISSAEEQHSQEKTAEKISFFRERERDALIAALDTVSDQVLAETVTHDSSVKNLNVLDRRQTLWAWIQSLSLPVRSRIWSFVLRRSISLHWCGGSRGDSLIAALLKVNRKTYEECRLIFLKVNTFSVNPFQLPRPFIPSASMNTQSFPSTSMTPSSKFTEYDRLGALRSLRFYMVQPSLASDPSRFTDDGIKLNSALDLLRENAPFLENLSITQYTQPTHEPRPGAGSPLLWHHNLMEVISRFRRLKRFTLLTCLEKSMLIGVPWQQRLAEVDPSSATTTCQRTPDSIRDYVPKELIPPDSVLEWHRYPRRFVQNHIKDILKPLGLRWLKIRVHYWPVEEAGMWEGTAWIVDLQPQEPITDSDPILHSISHSNR